MKNIRTSKEKSKERSSGFSASKSSFTVFGMNVKRTLPPQFFAFTSIIEKLEIKQLFTSLCSKSTINTLK